MRKLIFLVLFLTIPVALARGEEKVKTISHGEKVNLKDHVVKGKYTIFEFYADW